MLLTSPPPSPDSQPSRKRKRKASIVLPGSSVQPSTKPSQHGDCDTDSSDSSSSSSSASSSSSSSSSTSDSSSSSSSSSSSTPPRQSSKQLRGPCTDVPAVAKLQSMSVFSPRLLIAFPTELSVVYPLYHLVLARFKPMGVICDDDSRKNTTRNAPRSPPQPRQKGHRSPICYLLETADPRIDKIARVQQKTSQILLIMPPSRMQKRPSSNTIHP